MDEIDEMKEFIIRSLGEERALEAISEALEHYGMQVEIYEWIIDRYDLDAEER